MTRFYHRTLLGLAAASLIACEAQAPPPSTITARPEAPNVLLGHIVDRYWDEIASSSPWNSWGAAEMRFAEAPVDTIAPQQLADSLALERRYLADVGNVSRGALDADAKLTYDLFRRGRELAIESFTYPTELLPVNGFDSMPQRFALMTFAAERSALASGRDFDNWRMRALNYERWTNQAIVNLREGLRRGYTLPLPVVERTLPVLAALGADTPDNVFYRSMRVDSDPAAESDRGRLTVSITAALKDKILPAYRTLHDFLQREYLPRARVTVGLSALPLGDAWYAFLVKRTTGGTRTATELHALGMLEVEHTQARIQTLLAETAFAGNARGFIDNARHDPRVSFSSADALLNAYEELKTQVAAAVPTLFATVPRNDFQLQSVEEFRQATAPALSYRRSLAAGHHSAILYVNTAALDVRPSIGIEADYLREAVPGHHLQIALQQENIVLPRFRRFGGAPAFIEGWGLYAASLGEELGIYRDAEAKFGELLGQLECAAGLVVDTGLHSQNWTRAQALDYLHAHAPLDDVAAANTVDRALALPADALACTVGFLKIQAIKAHAQQALGTRFDIRAFHTEMLRNGAIPLDLLEADLAQWVEATATLE